MASKLHIYEQRTGMAKKFCIRNKILIAFFIMIVVDLGVLFILEKQTEKDLLRNQNDYRELLTSNSPFDVILTGDLQSSFYFNRSVPARPPGICYAGRAPDYWDTLVPRDTLRRRSPERRGGRRPRRRAPSSRSPD